MKRYLSYILRHYFNWLPDRTFIKLLYKFEMGESLNLDAPQTFQEKIQYLKLHNRKPEFTTMVDKFAVKEYVSNIIGDEYIIPTIAVWNSFDEIDFDYLPDKFVLKTTHGGGSCGVIICNDKTSFNKKEAKHKLEKSLKSDISKTLREWPYKNVPHRIIAEKLINLPDNIKELNDYKFFCFNGEPKFFKIDFGRFSDHHANYYDLEWNLLPFGEADFPPLPEYKFLPPPNFNKMIEIVHKLSKDKKFIRVDLYNVCGRIYFSELTFFPASGLGKFSIREWERKIGNLLDI